MKATYKTRNGRILFEVLAETPKLLFKGIAELHEIFEHEDTCGCCDSQDLKYRYRVTDGNDYYSIVCNHCTAEVAYGQTKDGKRMFLKRRDKEGHELPNNGWKVYRALPAAQQQQPARGRQ